MKYYIDNLAIRDEYGRQRIFRGENICFKKPYPISTVKKYFKNHLEYLKASGASIIRLGVTWEIIEPKEGKYNLEMINAVHDFVKKCEQNHIEVMLDMHQDLFSRKFFGDGMPKWVIDKSIKPQKYMAIWAEGYFYMNCVQRAFNDFWQNKNDVWQKFIKMWQFYRSKFDDCENIIGNDFLNEPFITDNGRKVFMQLVKRVVKENYNLDITPESYFDGRPEKIAMLSLIKDLAKIIGGNGGPVKLLNDTDNYEQFSKIIGGLEEYTKDFNKEFYQKFIDELSKAVTKEEFTFFEHNYYSNLGIPFEIETKENYVYSPHAYDLFVDSPLYNKYSSNNRIKYITDKIRENQLKMNVPVIFGEWGCGAKGTEWINHIEYVMDIMEQHQWSNIYWSYRHHNKEFTKRINRPYPLAICGDIVEYKTDSKNRVFTLIYNQSKELEDLDNQIYIPKKGAYHFKRNAGKHKITIKY